MSDALFPAARELVAYAGVVDGEHVLDLGAGAGNVALESVSRGARVSAIEPSSRLLALMRSRLTRKHPEAVAFADLREGVAEDLPFEDGCFDAVLSNFAVIFSRDAAASVAEAVRVCAAGGRLAFTTWLPYGAIHEASLEMYRDWPNRKVSPWESEESIRLLFAPHNLELSFTRNEVIFEGESAEAWFREIEQKHPIWRNMKSLRPDDWPEIRERSVELLKAKNEGSDGFRATSAYQIVFANNG